MKRIPEEKLKSICAEINGEYGLYVSIPEEKETLVLNGRKVFNAASTIKIPLLALLLKDFEERRLDPEKDVPLSEENCVGGSGVLNSLSRNLKMNLFDYAVLMIIISDNTATNQVIDAVGIDRANDFFRENGWKDTHLAGKLQRPKPLLPDGTPDYNMTSVADLGDMMEKILAGQMVSESVSRQMMQIMAGQQHGRFNTAVPVLRHAFPKAPLPTVIPEGRLLMANKGGSLPGKVSHDSAIFLLPNGRKAILSMTTATPDNNVTNEIAKRAAAALYEALLND